MAPISWKELPPLENPLILKLILDYSTYQDLNICRQVSKLWRSTCLKKWRSLVPVKIDSDEEMSSMLKFVGDPSNEFFSVPFTKYVLEVTDLRFCDLCGPHVKELSLHGITFQSPKYFRKLLYVWFPNMTKLTLKHIKLFTSPGTILEPSWSWRKEKFPEHESLKSLTLLESMVGICWMDLLKHFPNLERISVHGECFTGNEMFSALREIRQQDPTKLTTIKHIDTMYAPYLGTVLGGLFPVLCDATLKLESIFMSFSPRLEASVLREILRAHRTTLKKLNLAGCWKHLDPLVVLTPPEKLEKLEELTLRSFAFTSFQYLRFTPNLRKLVISDNVCPDQEAGLQDIVDAPLTRCTELELVHQTGGFLESLVNWLPNVERLRVGSLTNSGFAMVCERWPNLVKLDIFDTEVDEAGITGLDPEHVNMINWGEDDSWKPITVPRANITCLKHLRSFAMGPSIMHGQPIRLGHCAAVYGIQQLSHLQDLWIRSPKVWNEHLKLRGEIWEDLLAQFPWRNYISCQ